MLVVMRAIRHVRQSVARESGWSAASFTMNSAIWDKMLISLPQFPNKENSSYLLRLVQIEVGLPHRAFYLKFYDGPVNSFIEAVWKGFMEEVTSDLDFSRMK